MYSRPEASKRSSLLTANRTVATANDNRIIIQIKYDEDKPNQSIIRPPIPARRAIDLRPKSLAPISKVSSSDRNGVTRFSTYDVSDVCDDGRRHPKRPYNERPIDVPADFEREAYTRVLKHNQSPLRRKIKAPLRHLNPTLEDFLQVSTCAVGV